MKLKNLLPIFLFFLVGFSVVSAHKCGETGYFIPHGKFDTNRGLLFSSLASNVSAQGGFYNSSVGHGSDQVYAVGMCIPGAEPKVWKLWNNKSLLELVDLAMGENYDKDEVIRCIHIGLLCVQENPADRPTMSAVFQMLTNTSVTLPVPQPPGFVFRVGYEPNPLAERLHPGPSSTMSFTCSIDDASITNVSPR